MIITKMDDMTVACGVISPELVWSLCPPSHLSSLPVTVQWAAKQDLPPPPSLPSYISQHVSTLQSPLSEF